MNTSQKGKTGISNILHCYFPPQCDLFIDRHTIWQRTKVYFLSLGILPKLDSTKIPRSICLSSSILYGCHVSYFFSVVYFILNEHQEKLMAQSCNQAKTNQMQIFIYVKTTTKVKHVHDSVFYLFNSRSATLS